LGTECGEPGGAVVAGRAVNFGSSNTGPNPGSSTALPPNMPGKGKVLPKSPHGNVSPPVAAPPRGHKPAPTVPLIQLPRTAVVAITTQAPSGASVVSVQVSEDGKNWQTIAVMPLSGKEVTVYVDSDELLSQYLHVRFVYDDQ
jgi:hypothetical protein